MARGSSFCPVSGENASQKYTPLPFSQPTMSFDVVGQRGGRPRNQMRRDVLPQCTSRGWGEDVLAHAAFTHSEGFNSNGSIF